MRCLLVCRYNPELGDVVVGRVTEVLQHLHPQYTLLLAQVLIFYVFLMCPFQVANKRWRIDLKSRQAAALMLSAVNLPGGVQVCPLILMA